MSLVHFFAGSISLRRVWITVWFLFATGVAWAQPAQPAGGASRGSAAPAAGAATKPAPAATPTPAKPPAATQPASNADASKTRRERFHAAVAKLVAEANDLDNFEAIKNPPVFTRPHPALKEFGPETATEALNYSLQQLAGNEYRDTYIRWHLLWVISKVPDDERKATGPKLTALARMLPGPLNVKARVEARWEPQEIYDKYRAMVGHPPSLPNLQIVVGYPPFQRVIGPPESIKYLDAATLENYERAKAALPALQEAYKKRVAEADKLYGGQFKYIRDEGAVAFNARLRAMTEVMRHYRGLLIYAMISSGDPETAKLVMAEVCKRAKAKDGITFDLLSYLYLAAFDGVLGRYDKATLQELSKMLESTARESQDYVSYGGATRNFADAAFHLIELLKDGGGFFEPDEAPSTTPQQGRRRGRSDRR